MALTLVREGSAKTLLRDDKPGILFRFEDTFSVFDVGVCPQEIPGKGRAVCACAVQSFKIARTLDIPTCFMEQVDNATIRVRELAVIDGSPLTPTDTNCIVPAEWIFRYRVAGSLLRAFQSGKKKPTDYGFSTDEPPVEGTPLPIPNHMWTTKWEPTDRELTKEQALKLCGLTVKDAEEYWRIIDTLNGAINLVFHQAGYARFDGKMEVGLGPKREKMLADVFATQDEDRPVPLHALSHGHVEHFGKEFLRQYLIGNGYFKVVQDARAAGKEDPVYPKIPDHIIWEASRRYSNFAEAYTAVEI